MEAQVGLRASSFQAGIFAYFDIVSKRRLTAAAVGSDVIYRVPGVWTFPAGARPATGSPATRRRMSARKKRTPLPGIRRKNTPQNKSILIRYAAFSVTIKLMRRRIWPGGRPGLQIQLGFGGSRVRWVRFPYASATTRFTYPFKPVHTRSVRL